MKLLYTYKLSNKYKEWKNNSLQVFGKSSFQVDTQLLKITKQIPIHPTSGYLSTKWDTRAIEAIIKR